MSAIDSFAVMIYEADGDEHRCPVCDGELFPDDRYAIIFKGILYLCMEHIIEIGKAVAAGELERGVPGTG